MSKSKGDVRHADVSSTGPMPCGTGPRGAPGADTAFDVGQMRVERHLLNASNSCRPVRAARPIVEPANRGLVARFSHAW